MRNRKARLVDRLPPVHEQVEIDGARAPAGAVAYLRRQYYDTGLSANAPAIAATRDLIPLEHIVFGTDWPYVALPESGSDPAPALALLSAEERDGIDRRHAATLVPRLVATPS